MVSIGALNGVGDTRFTMWGGIACSWFVLLPTSYLFGIVLDGGAVGAWLGMTAEIVALGLLMLWRFNRNGWRTREVTAAALVTEAAAE
jgi:MATE family multidrug resistance protein